MTDYVLNHSIGRMVILVYSGSQGLTERTIRVISVNNLYIRGFEGDQIKTFRRDRILAAGWMGVRTGNEHHAQVIHNT